MRFGDVLGGLVDPGTTSARISLMGLPWRCLRVMSTKDKLQIGLIDLSTGAADIGLVCCV